MTDQPYTKISDNGKPSRPLPDTKISLASTTYNPDTFTDQSKLTKPSTQKDISDPDSNPPENLKNFNPDNIPEEPTIDIDSDATDQIFIPNPNFSPFKFYFFIFIHCVSGVFYGFQLSALSCLGKPIIHSSLKIYDKSSVDHWLGLFNLSFGLGKMAGSLIAGSFAKAIGKIQVLYLAEIFNVASCALIYFPSPGLFLAGRVIAGICCGFNSTCAPRLMLENYPTKYRGIPPAVYGLCLTIGLCWSYSIGRIFGDREM
jgi:predicted MFS family arabinose efflux permease